MKTGKAPIIYVDRVTGKREKEEVFGEAALELVYGNSFLAKTLGRFLLYTLARTSPAAKIYGYLKSRSASAKEIQPFIDQYGVDVSEFRDPVSSMRSFNDFFIRKLKPEVRPLAGGPETAVMPADGRVLAYQDISTCDGFIVKGQKFSLEALLKDKKLTDRYKGGSMLMVRLCPTDYHRFHFPCDCKPQKTQAINGWLYSVNPIALRQNAKWLTENKRTATLLKDTAFGDILFMEIGATCVGTIHQTFQAETLCKKGQEKGFFSFGGSALILLFERGTIQFDRDILANSVEHLETLCLMGQSLGNVWDRSGKKER